MGRYCRRRVTVSADWRVFLGFVLVLAAVAILGIFLLGYVVMNTITLPI